MYLPIFEGVLHFYKCVSDTLRQVCNKMSRYPFRWYIYLEKTQLKKLDRYLLWKLPSYILNHMNGDLLIKVFFQSRSTHLENSRSLKILGLAILGYYFIIY